MTLEINSSWGVAKSDRADHALEVGEHRLHQRRMERVRNRQWLTVDAFGLKRGLDRSRRLRVLRK